ncbi:MAG: hypothetical protein V1685_04110 [Parcubacteria group bacterium]
MIGAWVMNSIAPHWLYESMSVGLPIALIFITLAIIQRDFPEFWSVLTAPLKR